MNHPLTTTVLLALLMALPGTLLADDAAELRRINQAYLDGWLQGDAEGVLALFETGARIAPSGMCPVEGQQDMRAFWFPDDGSVTTVHRYEAQELGLTLLDDLGVTTQTTLLEWSYQKGDARMGRVQEGVATTVFRRQADGSWRIWRKMWTDTMIRDR